MSLPAFIDAGYKTLQLLRPYIGSSAAKTFPVAVCRGNNH